MKINGLRNYLETANTKIRVALVDLRNVIMDEKGQPCTFETGNFQHSESENPELFQNNNSASKNATESMMNTSVMNKSMINKIMTTDVNFLEMNEETIFITDIYYYCLVNDSWETLFLIFQILTEVKEEIDPNLHVVDKPIENIEGKVYQGFTWLHFQLFTNKILNVGRHLEHNIEPPLIKPPFQDNFNKTDDVTDFIIQEYVYDINQIDEIYDRLRMKREQKKKKKMSKQSKNLTFQ